MPNLLVTVYVLITSAALIVLKLGMKNGAPVQYLDSKLQFNITFYSMLGILLYGLSFLLYIYLISKNDLGYIIPLTTALVYVLIFSASYYIFHEQFTAQKIIGIALIVIGLIFLNLKR